MVANIDSLMQEPLSPVQYSEAACAMDFLDLDADTSARQWLYQQALATHTGDQEYSTQILGREEPAMSMIYLGIEDGRFLGYFSDESYTYRGAGGGLPTDPALSWAPYTLATVDDACALTDACRGVAGKTVEGACAAGEPRDTRCVLPGGEDELALGIYDISRAHFMAPAERTLFVELPADFI